MAVLDLVMSSACCLVQVHTFAFLQHCLLTVTQRYICILHVAALELATLPACCVTGLAWQTDQVLTTVDFSAAVALTTYRFVRLAMLSACQLCNGFGLVNIYQVFTADGYDFWAAVAFRSYMFVVPELRLPWLRCWLMV